MTFDLFDDEPAASVPSASAARAAVESHMMQPTGKPNEWTYRGVLVVCDMARAGLVDHWKTLDVLGDSIAKSDRRVALCKMIDAAVAATGAPR